MVGIGINLAQPQEYFDAAGLPHGTSLALQGVPVDMDTDPEWLAQYMTDFGFDRALYTYEAEGFAPYRERYKALCVNLGRRVTYDGGAGTAVDVDDEGPSHRPRRDRRHPRLYRRGQRKGDLRGGVKENGIFR